MVVVVDCSFPYLNSCQQFGLASPLECDDIAIAAAAVVVVINGEPDDDGVVVVEIVDTFAAAAAVVGIVERFGMAVVVVEME